MTLVIVMWVRTGDRYCCSKGKRYTWDGSFGVSFIDLEGVM